MDNDGSYIAPWSTLQEVFDHDLIETQSWSPLPYEAGVSVLIPKNEGAPVHAGDTLMLLSGLHGKVFIRGAVNAADIVIMAAPGAKPILADIQLSAAMHWQLIGLTFDASAYNFTSNGTFIFLESHGWHGPSAYIRISGCTLRSIPDAASWSMDDWNEKSVSGILIEGDHSVVEDNILLNVNFGISISGNSSQVLRNRITNFAGDGIRPNGSFINVESNIIKNCYDVNANHDDGIQSFNLNNERFEFNTIRGNTIINYEDINQPFRGALQGIGCFDGPYRNWTIENNLIVVDHWHGISMYGAYDCKIINNTVIDPTPDVTPGPAWILVTDHKDGTPSEGCVVQNNLACQINVDTLVSNNLIAKSYADYDLFFSDFNAGDFSLNASSPAIDAGLDSVAPHTDIRGVIRPQGAHVDVGAYEYVDSVSNHVYSIDNQFGKLKAFPNPVNEQLYLVGKIQLPVFIYSTSGKLRRIVTEVEYDSHSSRISLPGLENGAYFLITADGYHCSFIKK
jgi:parallel beta-helix repeat protein